MIDLAGLGTKTLNRLRERTFTQTVSYARGATTIVVKATLGSSEREVPDDEGVLHLIEIRDFLVLAENLVDNATPVVPRKGDEITVTLGGNEQVFRVLSEPGLDAFAWADPQQTTYRIHTKLVSGGAL